jgi:predicted acetyltransferase
MTATSHTEKSARSISLQEAETRIDKLRKEGSAAPLVARSTPENLALPLDERIVIASDFPTHRIALMVDGEDVSGTLVFDFAQHFGPCRLRMGGVAGVRTHRDHRFKGYSRIVLENMLRWMYQEGFDVSQLGGITAFYPKFGYVKAFPETYFEFKVCDAERLIAKGYTFVDYEPKYLTAVLSMFRRNQSTRIGPTERDRRHWRPFRKGITWGPKAVCRVAIDRRRRAVGYFVYDDALDEVMVLEVGHVCPDVFPDIILAASGMAWKRRLSTFRFRLPEDDEVMAYGMHLGVKKEVIYSTDGGPMVRMINSHSALEKAGPLLAGRMNGQGRLCLQTNNDKVWLSWSAGELAVSRRPLAGAAVVRLPQWALASLLYGYCSAPALAADGSIKTTVKALELLSEMFPVTPHYHSRIDAF